MLHIFYSRVNSPDAMARPVVSRSRAEAEALRAKLTANGEIAGEIVDVGPKEPTFWDLQPGMPTPEA